MVTARFRSPDFRSAQSNTTHAVAIFVRLPTCSFFLGSCSSKMYPVCASAIRYACAATAERTTEALARNARKTIRTRRGECIRSPERQHLNRRTLIRKRLPRPNATSSSRAERWIGWKARPLLRIRYGSEDDAEPIAEGANCQAAKLHRCQCAE